MENRKQDIPQTKQITMKHRIFQFYILTLICTLSSCKSYETVEDYLDKIYQKGELNGNVLVVINGETIYEKSFGFADGSKTTKLNKDYRFIIGSVYKEFPAVAIMQLQEQGYIHLEDKIVKYLPELPEWSKKVSIKHLLQYSSGLPTVPWDEYFGKNITITDEYLFTKVKNIENLQFEPGSDYIYSNNNPITLMKIVEAVTNMPFVNYVKEHIFNPFNLNNTVIKDQYPYQDKKLMAIPFNTSFEEDDYTIATKSFLFTSTARDMIDWLEVLGNFEVVSKSSIKTLSEEAKIGDNIQSPLGRCDWENEKVIEHSHHGSSGNYECVVRRFKQEGITIVILTNQKHSNVYGISNEIYKKIKI